MRLRKAGNTVVRDGEAGRISEEDSEKVDECL